MKKLKKNPKKSSHFHWESSIEDKYRFQGAAILFISQVILYVILRFCLT